MPTENPGFCRTSKQCLYCDLLQALKEEHSFCQLCVLNTGDLGFCVRSAPLREEEEEAVEEDEEEEEEEEEESNVIGSWTN